MAWMFVHHVQNGNLLHASCSSDGMGMTASGIAALGDMQAAARDTGTAPLNCFI